MKVRHIPVKSGDTLLVPGDLHFDRHDPEALDLMLEVATAFNVNTTILTGDTYESAGISRHPKLRARMRHRFGAGTIRAESEASAPYLTLLRRQVEALRTTRQGRRAGGLHVLTGNHEAWWNLLQDDYPGLVDTPWHELYGDIFNGWHIHADGTALKLGPLLVCHGHGLRGGLSRNSAISVLAAYPGQNTVYGHTHRVESCITPSRKYGLPVDHGAWTIGHLKSLEAEASDPEFSQYTERHKQGFALVDFFELEGEMRFKLDQVTIDRTASGRPYALVRGILFS